MPNFAQIQASDPEFSSLVLASAGTGKTKILTDRVLRIMVQTKANWKKILCITFTNNAANEMLTRISTKLSQWSEMKAEQLEADLKKLLGTTPSKDELKNARGLLKQYYQQAQNLKIKTIHSFCQYILKKFSIEAGLSPYFQVIDEIQANNILWTLKQEILRNYHLLDENVQNIILSLLESFNDNEITEIFSHITKYRIEFSRLFDTSPSTSEYYHQLALELDLNPEYQSTDCILKIIIPQLKEKFFNDDLQNVSLNLTIECYKFFDQSLQDQIAQFNDFQKLFLTQEDEKRKNIVSTKFSKENFELSNKIFQFQDKIYQCNQKLKSFNIAQKSLCLFALAKILLQKYETYKQHKCLLDYDDLIIYTYNLLNQNHLQDWILYKLDGGIDHLLIDEAQDTSLLQWEIIKAILTDYFHGSEHHKTNRTLFIVGDGKQSIYSFQGANLELFDKITKDIQKLMIQSGKKHALIKLDQTYRYNQAILTLVEKVFSTLNHKNTAIFPDFIKIKCHRNNVPGMVEIMPLFSSDEHSYESKQIPWSIPERDYDSSNSQKYQLFADSIARYIKNLLSQDFILPSTNKKPQPSDIVILVRTRNQLTASIIKALQYKNISIAGIDRENILDNILILDILSIAKFALYPYDDLNLAALLKSPIIGLTEDDLQNLAIKRFDQNQSSTVGNMSINFDKTLWKYIQDLSTEKMRENHIEPKNSLLIKETYLFLKNIIELSKHNNLTEFFHILLETMDLRSKLSDSAPEKIDIINDFLILVRDFGQNFNNNLHPFLKWSEENIIEIKRGINLGNRIRIMTVHAAKGLEAPIIILADTTSSSSYRKDLLWTENSVFGLFTIKDLNSKIKSLYEQNVSNNYKEYLRLLYVGLTRAQDYLAVFGFGQKTNIQDSWYDLIWNAMDCINESIKIKAEETEEHKLKSGKNYYGIKYQIGSFDRIEKDYMLSSSLQNKAEIDLTSPTDPSANIGSVLKDGNINLPKVVDKYYLESNYLNQTYTTSNKLLANQSIFQKYQVNSRQNYNHYKSMSAILQYDRKMSYGKIVHKILEDIINTGNVNLIEHHHLLRNLDQQELARLQSGLKKLINSSVMATLLNAYELHTEISISLKSALKTKIGRIDLLAISDEKIIIVDYKTDSKPSKIIPQQYIDQLSLYYKSISEIYQNKHIEVYILWFETTELMLISNKRLEKSNF